jgi:muramoyltetrapeptide carboxypeptidase
MPVLIPRPLREGDSIALLAPASNAEDDWIDRSIELIRDWRFKPRLGAHVRERHGYMAGTDAARLEDLNQAIRDPEVRAIVTLRGGCGSFRLLHGIDLAALRRDPKLLIGYSDITALHLAWNTAGVATLHGPLAGDHVEDVRMLLTGQLPEPIVSDPRQFGAELTTHGVAAGPLAGGNLEMLARRVGVLDIDLRGHIVLLELTRAAGLGMVDRALSQLLMSGTLEGVEGVALGHLQGFEDYVDRGWNVVDVLRERLAELAVPILSGLPLGHLPSPRIVPMGTEVLLDAHAGRLVPRPLA